MEFIEYSKCTTCKKAKKFLIDNNIEFIDRQINIDIPSYDELKKWVNNYDVKVNKLFNTMNTPIPYSALNYSLLFSQHLCIQPFLKINWQAINTNLHNCNQQKIKK